MERKPLKKYKPKWYKDVMNDKDSFYDKLGVNFSDFFESRKINCTDHQPTLRSTFIKIMNEIKIDRKWFFCDCGSGLGQVLYLASDYFENLIGIEHEFEIFKVSEKNLKLCMPSSVRYKILNDDIKNMRLNEEIKNIFDLVNLYYLYNPFIGDVFESFMENIADSIKRNDRDIYIIYANPTCESIVEKYSNLFKLEKQCYCDKLLVNYYRH
jgi:hypothetical protein